MKIRELYIKNFGKFSDKRILLEDGINIFYGENESGKTTIHTFVKCMLFGLERGRGRGAIGDTFRIYEPWENPNYYSGVIRFESGGKTFRLSRNFDRYAKGAALVCEDDGEEFSLEHGDLEMILNGLEAANYENTISIGQRKIETNQSLAAELQNFATNYYATGNSEIDLEKAIGTLSQKKKDTERDIRAAEQELQQKVAEIEHEKSYIWRELHSLEEELEEVEKQLDVENENYDEIHAQNVSVWRVHPLEWLAAIVVLLFIVILLPRPWSYLLAIVAGLGEGILIWNRMKDEKKKPLEQQLSEISEKLQKLQWKKERLQEEIKEKNTAYGNMEEQLEELKEENQVSNELGLQKQALELAMDRMLELSKDVRMELSVKLNEKSSEILSQITGGKYDVLFVDEKLSMSLYSDGRRISLEQVSRGTIEQIYFALRMAASHILHEEEYPVILDDTFVFYDDVRLENTLRWLLKNRKQVLIFTCQKREQELLDKILGR